MNRCRGLTLIEILVALSLTGMLMVSVLSWTQTSCRMARDTRFPIRWQCAAHATLELIHDDLVSGDFELPAENATLGSSDQGSPTNEGYGFQVRSRGLDIHTRSRTGSASDVGQAVLRHYSLEPARDRLVVSETPLGHQEVLLESVADLKVDWDVEKRLLAITISSTHESLEVSRYYSFASISPGDEEGDS